MDNGGDNFPEAVRLLCESNRLDRIVHSLIVGFVVNCRQLHAYLLARRQHWPLSVTYGGVTKVGVTRGDN